MAEKWLLAGLGNPGSKYENNRHNIGFLLLDIVAASLSSSGKISWRKSDGAEVLQLRDSNIDLHLIKPLEFMNNSGRSLVKYLKYANIEPDRLIVAHDEVELPFAKMRLKFAGGHAGHNGIKSIAAHLASDDFYRLRLGVGRPENTNYDLADWVLSNFSTQEQKVLPEFLAAGFDCARVLITSGLAKAQAQFNG